MTGCSLQQYYCSLQTLEEIDAQQKKQIEALKAELKEAENALANQKETNCQLNKQMVDQERKIRDNDILKVELKKELKEKKALGKAVSEKLEKEQENLHSLGVKFKDAQKDGCKVNHTLQQERRKGDRKEAELKEEIVRLSDERAGLQSTLTNLTNKINEQRTEIQQLRVGKEKLGDKFFQQEITITKLEMRLGTMDARIGYMQLRHKTDEIENTSRRLQINDYKRAISEIKNELEKTQEQHDAEMQTLAPHLESLKAECKRRSEINEADNETKANMKMDIGILYQLQVWRQAIVVVVFTPVNNLLHPLRDFKRAVCFTLNGRLEEFDERFIWYDSMFGRQSKRTYGDGDVKKKNDIGIVGKANESCVSKKDTRLAVVDGLQWRGFDVKFLAAHKMNEVLDVVARPFMAAHKMNEVLDVVARPVSVR
ncbi:protein CASP-like [Stylophora pistillata]|uniref:protein CASP-like n=1 Tax=Stylophora pistillata TaxID=50429 RepID=UPI000C0525E6|nr:protein CASP-like [Stylophora pistillata]